MCVVVWCTWRIDLNLGKGWKFLEVLKNISGTVEVNFWHLDFTVMLV